MTRRWLRQQLNDEYVKLAHRKGRRSRAAFKLLEMQSRFRLIEPGMTVVDLGAAPGGWSQMAAEWATESGRVIALDLRPMAPLSNVECVCADFSQGNGLDALLRALNGNSVDVLLSDMAPNLSGVSAIDQPRAMFLSELAVDCAMELLAVGGSMLVKVFQGEGLAPLCDSVRSHFGATILRKPRASRPSSSECYLLAHKRRP